jgi:hypothetical protein
MLGSGVYSQCLLAVVLLGIFTRLFQIDVHIHERETKVYTIANVAYSYPYVSPEFKSFFRIFYMIQ